MTISYSPTEEMDLVRSTARQFLDERIGIDTVRELMMSADGFDRGLWKEIADLGWVGLAVPEEYGGAGYGFVELSVLLEEMGTAVTPGPFFASAVLATSAIESAGDDEQKAALLPRLASGETIGTLAVFETPRGWDIGSVNSTARLEGDGWVLDGTKRYVLDGHMADLIVVAARMGDAGVGMFVVESGTPGMTVTQTPTLDSTRRQADITLEGVAVPASALLGEGPSEDALRRTLALGVAGLAAEQVGGAQRCLEMSTQYAKERFQFGRAIGSYQAIKHRCAEMLVKTEHAKSTAFHAVRVTDDPEEFAIAAPLAGSVCSEAYLWIAGENIQVHGGIGFTWEHDAHLYFKRAKASSLMLGDSRHHRRMLGDAVGL